MKYHVKTGGQPEGKPKVYFACHPEDFSLYFESLNRDVQRKRDCVLYFAEDPAVPTPEEELERCNLVVVPVTFRLLTEPSPAMDTELPLVLSKKIPLLPIMMEANLVSLFNACPVFAGMQYLDATDQDPTKLPYQDKLERHLQAVLISDELAQRVRDAFDAYIFLSYRKMDRSHANTLMRMIHSRPGYRDIAIWYDEFLTPGESFRQNIERFLHKSQLFALLVTPNVLEERDGVKNFVMGNEYPAAKKSGLPVLPVEMEKTDRVLLAQKFDEIPPCLDPYDEEEFTRQLLDTLTQVVMTEKTNDSAHNYLMGLAYLEGIHVEVDKDRGLALIVDAAQTGLPEAMEDLYEKCSLGIYPQLPREDAVRWAQALAEHYEADQGPEGEDTLSWKNNLAYTYSELWQYEKALPLNRDVAEATQRLYGFDDKRTLTAMGNLADTCLELGNAEQAQHLLETAYGISCRIAGKNDPNTMGFANNLARVYLRRSLHHKALPLQEDIYAACCETMGQTDLRTLNVTMNLANLYRVLEQPDRALALLEETRSQCLEQLPEDLPEAQEINLALAQVYLDKGRSDDALLLQQSAYQSCRRLQLPQSHPLWQRTQSCRRDIHLRCRQFREALSISTDRHLHYCDQLGQTNIVTLEALLQCGQDYIAAGMTFDGQMSLERACKLYREHYGPSNPDTVGAMLVLAKYHMEAGNSEEADRIFEEAYRLAVKHLGEKHEMTLAAISGYAMRLSARGDVRQALKLYRTAEKGYCRLYSADSPKTLTVQHNLAHTLMLLEQWEEALALTRDVYARRLALFGERCEDTLQTKSLLAELHRQLDHKTDSLALYKEVFRDTEALYGPDHPETYRAKCNLASAYASYGNLQRALRLHREVYDARCRLLSQTHPDTLESLEQLAVAYGNVGQTDQAVTLASKLVKLRSEQLPPQHPDVAQAKRLLSQLWFGDPLGGQ